MGISPTDGLTCHCNSTCLPDCLPPYLYAYSTDLPAHLAFPHAFPPAYLPACVHAWVRECMHAYLCACVHACVQVCFSPLSEFLPYSDFSPPMSCSHRCDLHIFIFYLSLVLQMMGSCVNGGPIQYANRIISVTRGQSLTILTSYPFANISKTKIR